MSEEQDYPLEEALKALGALRQAAGLEPERFPVRAFVGMISDEVDALRRRGMSDEEIAELVRGSSSIRITGQEIAENYAWPEERARRGG